LLFKDTTCDIVSRQRSKSLDHARETTSSLKPLSESG
jgi:hypothetical protein